MRNQGKSTRTGQLYKKGSTFRWTTPFSITIKFFVFPIRIWMSYMSVSLLIQIEKCGWVEPFFDQSKRLLFSQVFPSWPFWEYAVLVNFFSSLYLERWENHKATCFRRVGSGFLGKCALYGVLGTVMVTHRLVMFYLLCFPQFVGFVWLLFRRVGWHTWGGLGMITGPRGSPSVWWSSSWYTVSIFFMREYAIFDRSGMLSVNRWIVLGIGTHWIVEESMGRFVVRILMDGNCSNGVVVWVFLWFVLCIR